MTPYESVLAEYKLPSYIRTHAMQVETVNDLGTLTNHGQWLDMGTGKTLCASMIGLYHIGQYGHRVVVVMPPLLVPQWGRWLRSITPSPSVTEYTGTPAQRAKLNLNVDFVLVGVQIFKRDVERFQVDYAGTNYTVFIDEATLVCNVGSANHQVIYDFCIGHYQGVLTGTPANNPMDAYGLLKFSAPGVYRNKKQFENLHVAARDFYDKPVKFKDLDVLASNLLVNSKRILYSDMYRDIDEPLITKIDYDLDPAHYRLYRKLAEEELLKLPSGGKVDATTANKLRHALGQIVTNWAHFSEQADHVSNAVWLIDEKLRELGGKKLVVFADYRMTVAACRDHLKEFGVVTVNSDVTGEQRQANIGRFINDPRCRVIVIQFKSGGYGLDGLQHVCHHMMFIEPCQQPRDFHQCVARLKRTGQLNRVMVMLAIANGTTQPRGFSNLLDNDDLVNQVIRNATDLRASIFGG